MAQTAIQSNSRGIHSVGYLGNLLWEQDAAGSNPVARTSPFGHHFMKGGGSYAQ